MSIWGNDLRAPWPPVRKTVVQFLFASAAATVVVFLAAGVISEQVAEKEVSDVAGDITSNLAKTLAPMVDADVRAADPAALEDLAIAVQARTAYGQVRRVKIWGADGNRGVVLYSDAPDLIGQTFELDPDDVRALQTNEVESEVSEVDRAENRYENDFGPMVEVYVGAQDATGQRILVETYFSVDGLAQRKSEIARRIAPAVLVPLTLLLLLILPLAVSLARRVARQEAERSTLVRLAAEASASERRKMAGVLHDGVIQDLSGIGYALAVVEGRLTRPAAIEEQDRSDMLRALRTSLEVVRSDVTSLRSIITTLYTSAIEDVDLRKALLTVATDAQGDGMVVLTQIGPIPSLPSATSAAIFQVGREALRNAIEHSHASTLRLTLTADERVLRLAVEDDGVGYDAPNHGPAQGHLGLSLMQDSARSVGGTLEMTSAVGSGTTVRMTVPLPLRRGSRTWLRAPRQSRREQGSDSTRVS